MVCDGFLIQNTLQRDFEQSPEGPWMKCYSLSFPVTTEEVHLFSWAQEFFMSLSRFNNCFICEDLLVLVHLTDLQPSIQRCQVQRCFLLAVSHGGVSQLVKQHWNYIGVSVLRCTVQRRFLLMVLRKNERKEGLRVGSMEGKDRGITEVVGVDVLV